MEVAVTFGSLGDIMAICHVALQLGRALATGADGTSAKEYQALRNDLDTFVEVLMQVVATYEQHEPSPWLRGLDSVTKAVIDDCAHVIQQALDRFVPRYQNNLRPGG